MILLSHVSNVALSFFRGEGMKVLIISGFLGAGKTTFIKKLVEKTNNQVVILENEFGDSNLDGKYLETSLVPKKEDIKILELTQGCICCSVNLDLTYSILTIYNTLNPDYLIIEPSGVAKLSRVLEKLKKIEYVNIEIGMPITIIDHYNMINNFKNNGEYILDCINHSGLIVLSNSENLSTHEFSEIQQQLNLSDYVKFPLKHYNQWDGDYWSEVFDTKSIFINKNNKISLKFIKKSQMKEKFEQMSFSSYNINNADELSLICTYLMSGRLGDVDRAKGNIVFENYCLKFDLVGQKYVITGSDNRKINEVIVIGKNLNREGLKKIFRVKEE